MDRINIGILGCGTVGTGVAKILLEKGDLLTSRIGVKAHLKYVADIDTQTDRGIAFPEGVFIADAETIIEDPEIAIVIETIGGEGIAKTLIEKAIAKGKHVITANKALLAKQGSELFAAAVAKGVDLAYEASVCGCMPIIKTMRESLVGNRIDSMTGILNGTCNYILSRITFEGISFQEALGKAQEGGYAEADPTLDVEGLDAAHKIAILSALAFGIKVDFDTIYIEGISRITPLDIEFAQQFGYRIKLLAIAKDKGDAIEARVHPTMIPIGSILSNVNGTLNAVAVRGDAIGEILLSGHGAGMLPTASAVISDTADLIRNIQSGSAGRVPPLAFQPDRIRDIPVMPISEIVTHYYIRFAALDQPGVLSKISGILGAHDISLKSVHQKGRKTNGSVPLVMFTHHAKEADIVRALEEIAALDVVSDTPLVIRIEDENGEDE
jgi:homoserine dehydrogenase